MFNGNPVPERIAGAARKRIDDAKAQIQQTVANIDNGRALQSETEDARAIRRVEAVVGVNADTARRIVGYESPSNLGLTASQRSKAEVLQGTTVDYIGVAWLDAGRLAANAVARILRPGSLPLGTGFLASSRLLLTNNHVIPTKQAARSFTVEFRYEVGLNGQSPSPVRFELDPDSFFETDDEDDLDYTLIALGRPITPGATAIDFGACPLSSSSAKHSVGESVNIIQHPDGDYKQIVVRENRILHRGQHVLHYTADTEPGASGSPVFNDEWQVIALHHWGEPHREQSAGGRRLRTDVNEGIRISAIVAELEQRSSNMDAARRRLLFDALHAAPPGQPGTRSIRLDFTPGPQSIRSSPLPEANSEAAGAPASRIDTNYSNRRGYNERFLPGFPVPMPQLNAAQRRAAARVRSAGVSSNPFEIKYQHFSVVLNADRRMAFFSICNIDGSKRITVDRDSGLATSGPEATEVWATDPRVPDNAQLDDAFYARIRRDLRTPADFFARGHLTRREDPNWGVALSAQRANNDTFHHTNACPQAQNAFNGSQKVWQGIENFVLNAADDSNLRVTVITGPVFSDDDPAYDDELFGTVQFPKLFWKIVARVEDGRPLVFAVLADQSVVMDSLFAARREAFWDWPRKLSTEFKSTVAEIAELTGLDFANLADFDIFAGRPGRELLGSPESLVPRNSASGAGFGKFASIGDFLESWEHRSIQEPPAGESLEEIDTEPGPERRRRRPRPRPRPQPRQRKVVEVEAKVARVFADDLSGAKHQQFTVIPTRWISGDAGAQPEIAAAIAASAEARVAVRFGDSMGIADRIPGIRTNVELKLKGEWISARDAYDVGGEDLPVLHFTHDPLGFVCTPVQCYS
jgi:endonuclease G